MPRSVAFAVLSLAITSRVSASPPPGWQPTSVPVRAMDDRGAAVVPDRIECEVAYFAPVVGLLPLVERCAEWDYVLHPDKAPIPDYVPYRFDVDGTATLKLPFMLRRHGLVSPIVFIRAHSSRYRDPALLVLDFVGDPWTNRVWPLVFFRKRGKAPILTKPPSCSLVPAKQDETVPVRLVAEFKDPEGEPLFFKWIFVNGRRDQGGMEAGASLFAGPQLLAALACDPRGNCTSAYFPVDVQPLPAYVPNRLLSVDKDPDVLISEFPSITASKKKPKQDERIQTSYYPSALQRCSPPSR